MAPVAKVSPLATVSSLPIIRAAQRYFTAWLAEHLVAGLLGIVFLFSQACLCPFRQIFEFCFIVHWSVVVSVCVGFTFAFTSLLNDE